MTNEQILKKAIEKAVKGGYFISDDKIPGYLITVNCNHYYRLIFSHDFAKAFWGTDCVSRKEILLAKQPILKYFYSNRDKIYEWEYHLQQMVLEEDKLKYIEKFLDK